MQDYNDQVDQFGRSISSRRDIDQIVPNDGRRPRDNTFDSFNRPNRGRAHTGHNSNASRGGHFNSINSRFETNGGMRQNTIIVPTVSDLAFQGDRPQIPSHSSMEHFSPMMSFRSFVQTLRDDLSPEVYQKKYDEYQYQYLLDFSNNFFEMNKYEEWFRERYDAIKLIDKEDNLAEWAAKESHNIQTALLSNPQDVISACCLEPQSSIDTISNEKTTAIDKFFPGHAHHVIKLTGIPDCCSKKQLQTAITQAFTNPTTNLYATSSFPSLPNAPIPLPDRILIGQPRLKWSPQLPPKYEKQAFLILPSNTTKDVITSAVGVLQSLRVVVSTSPDLLQCSRNFKDVTYEFILEAIEFDPNTERNRPPTLPDFLSFEERVQNDTKSAMELASLLDIERRVPIETQLASLLAIPEVVTVLQQGKPTDTLDFSIAYLRRVHCALFYEGRILRDEFQMLTATPIVLHRTIPFVPTSNSLMTSIDESIEKKDDEEKEEVQEDYVREKRRRDDFIEEDQDVVDDVNNIDPEDTSERGGKRQRVDQSSQLITSSSNITRRPFPLRNKFVTTLIHDLRQGNVKLLKLQQEVEVIRQLNDEIFNSSLQSQAIIEVEGKSRCFFHSCRKLFKSIDFLSKHMKIKHEEFCYDAFLDNSYDSMRSRFESDELLHRPLPPIRVETSNGIEYKTIQEILSRVQPIRPVSTSIQSFHSEDRERGFQMGRDGGHGRMNDRRGPNNSGRGRHNFTNNNSHHHTSNQHHNYNHREGTSHQLIDRDAIIYEASGNSKILGMANSFHENTNTTNSNTNTDFSVRQKITYLDMDAPKDSSISVDYGVVMLPPKKKKKILLKK